MRFMRHSMAPIQNKHITSNEKKTVWETSCAYFSFRVCLFEHDIVMSV